MKRVLLIAMLALGTIVSAITPVTDQITVATANIGFTSSKVQGANSAFCRLELAEIRYDFGGQNASTTAGFLWEIGEEKTISNTTSVPNALQTFNAVRTGATSGQLDCKYY